MQHQEPGFAGRSAVFFLLATVVMTWPMAVSPGDHFSSRQDFYLGLWNLWWVARTLSEPGLGFFSTELLYFPVGTGLEVQPLSLLQTVPAAPLTLLFGPAVAYNVLVLLSFWLAGWATSLWVRALTGERMAGLAAGAVFAFSPYHYTYLGQLNLVPIGVVPLYFLAALALQRRPTLPRAALAGVALAAVGLASWYYGVGVGLAAVALSVARLVRAERGPLARRCAVEAVHYGACGLLIGPLVLRLSSGFALSAAREVEYPSMGLVMTSFKESGVTMALHSFVGIAALALALVGAFSGRRAAPLVALALGFLVLSLGASAQLGEAVIPLPYAWLETLPVVGAVRFPDRFFVLTQLGVAALAGLGAARLCSARRGALLAGALVALPLLEYWPGPLSSVPAPEVAPVPPASADDAGAVLHFPVWFRNLDGESMYHQTAHGRPIPGGYLTRRNGRAVRALHEERHLQLMLRPPPAQLPAGFARGLRRNGFAYVCIQLEATVPGVERRPHAVFGPYSLTAGPFLAQRLFPTYPERAQLDADAAHWVRLLSAGWGPPLRETALAAVFSIPSE